MGYEMSRVGGPKPLPQLNRARAFKGGATKKRVLIVDDSATMRALIRQVLSADSRLQVVGEAEDPYVARESIKQLQPDVITLDIEMPRMSGLEFLEKLMRLHPLPVVMLSTLTAKGSAAAVRALQSGAVDCLPKPKNVSDLSALQGFSECVWSAANAKAIGASQPPKRAKPHNAMSAWNGKLVLVGSSTGGVGALETLLSDLPGNSAPMVVTQHMPEKFLHSFAERLNSQFPQSVTIAQSQGRLNQGDVILAHGDGQHLKVSRAGGTWGYSLIEGPKRNGHCPSVDVMFESAQEWASQTVSVILTGLGRDGAQSMKYLADAGSVTLGQDETSSVVYGMPRAAYELGAVQTQLPIHKIGQAVLAATARASR